MKKYFEMPINYNERKIEIKVATLSDKLPKIIYAVWTKDEELNKRFKNVKQFNFHINSKLNDIGNSKISHYVFYDYKTLKNQVKDIQFEWSVWNALLELNL